MDKGSLAYFKDKAKKGAVLADKLEYCESKLRDIEKSGMKYVNIAVGVKDGGELQTSGVYLRINNQDSVDCFGDIALQVIKDLRDRYQAEFDAL